jgi:hypothetical protein
MKDKELPGGTRVSIHRNYFEHLKRQNQEHRALSHKIGKFLWFITAESPTREEIIDKLGDLFPAWKGYKGVEHPPDDKRK